MSHRWAGGAGRASGTAQVSTRRRPPRGSAWTLLGTLGLALLVLLGSAVAPPPRPARAEALLGSGIALGAAPTFMAADPTTNRIYVTSASPPAIRVIDGVTNTVIGNPIAMPVSASGIAVDPALNKLYVSSFSDNRVRVFDPTLGALVGNAIPVGLGPIGLAVDPVSHRVYTANLSAGTVTVIDGATFGNLGAGDVVGTITVGGQPRAVAVNPTTHRAYVTNIAGGVGTVSVIQGAADQTGAAGTVVGSPISVGTSPNSVAVNASTNHIYTASYTNGTVTVIRGTGGPMGEGTSIGLIIIGSNLAGVAVSPNGNRLYVTNEGPGTVTVIDGRTSVIDGPAITVGSIPSGLVVNPTTGFVYVANTGGTTVSVIGTPYLQEAAIGTAIPVGLSPDAVAVDPTTGRVHVASVSGSVAAIDGTRSDNGGAGALVGQPIGAGASVVDLAVNPSTHRVYVTSADNDHVRVIDGAGSGNGGTGTLVGQPIPVGDSPTGVAVNPLTNRIYVGNRGPDTVSVIDGAPTQANPEGTVVGSPIAVGQNPFVVAINPTSNPTTTRVYVYNQDDATISVLDGAGATVRPPIAVGAANDLAVNPANNRLYLPLALESNIVSVIDGATGADVVPPISVGVAPRGVAINPVTNRVYVLSQLSATVSPIDGAVNRVVGVPVAVGSNARSLTVNPSTGRVYVTNGDDGTVSVLGPTFNVKVNGAAVTGAARGSTVQVTWGALFGTSANDRVGLFTAGTADNASPASVVFTNGTGAPGGVGLAAGTVNLPIPANQAPGAYEIRLVSGHASQTLGSLALTVLVPPVAGNDAYSGSSGSTLSVPAGTGLLANDTDLDTPTGLTAQVVANPQNGTLNLQASGAFTYTPTGSFTGTDTFTYRVVDTTGLTSNTATVTITVNAVACGPRPSVTVTTAVSGGALQATVTATTVNTPNNRISELRFGTLQNAQVTLNGNAISSGQVVPLAPNTLTQAFTVRRTTPGQATTVPLTVVDTCGSWPTFVGGGPAAGF